VNKSCIDQPALTETTLIPHGRYKINITVRPLRLGYASEAAVIVVAMPESGKL
jgi:hypothetical protein